METKYIAGPKEDINIRGMSGRMGTDGTWLEEHCDKNHWSKDRERPGDISSSLREKSDSLRLDHANSLWI